MNLLEMAFGNEFNKTGEMKKLSVKGKLNNMYDVYAIPLEYLYYNDQNGRINTTYKKYKAAHGSLIPEPGNSEYNKIFEEFIYDSNRQALEKTLLSIKDNQQQEPGVVLPDGRVIDGNRRLTALRKYQEEDGIKKDFNAIILSLDTNSKKDEKIIKELELELDLQLGREERVSYDPIDRIFDVYNTIEIEKLMTAEEYKKASGAGNTKGINRDIRLANLILKFINIVSPGGDAIDKFYLARDLKLDGPIEEIEGTINKLKNTDKEAITEAVLVHLAVSKVGEESKDTTRVMRDLKTNVLNNPEILDYYLDAVDEKVDVIMEAFEESPIKSSNDIKIVIDKDEELQKVVGKLKKSTFNLVRKGKNDTKRKKALVELENTRDQLEDLTAKDFAELTVDENIYAKDVLIEITDIIFKLKKELKL
ncbi:ParB N-terminal domain-containing protein [uncultured Vagococcus sp.]|uniref:ParB N-terminal domain-containing protein n=1 Tax=uncultured Vagococcus sp. TaxID=189676 RepID=UPI0025838B9F|nr:ParB N-terminal domain-containing protein [uncultured Vagococcus sp.]